MTTKKLLDYAKIIDGFEVVNLDEEEVKKIIKDGHHNIYNIFSSYYHNKLERQIKPDYSFYNEGIYTETKLKEICLYCARDHVSLSCPFVICKRCGNRGHTHKNCENAFLQSKSTLCKKCISASHSEFDCPAIYRKYKTKKITNVIKSCANCAGDHFTNDCSISLENSRFSIFDEKYFSHMKK